jgi:hypothetical protein
MLQYLALHALNHPGTPIKEYQIATEVFGRHPDFDPQLDSTIRVQAGRLRSKLAEYYTSEGAEDPILVDMPKGNYALAFHPRPLGSGRSNAWSSHDASDAVPDKGQPSRRWFAAIIVFSVVLAAAVAVATDRFLTRKTAEARLTIDSADVPVAFHVFWKGFLIGTQEPWVIFSNAAFVGGPYIGMRYYDRARDSRAVTLDHYTGSSINKFASSAVACSPWMMQRTTILSSSARPRKT